MIGFSKHNNCTMYFGLHVFCFASFSTYQQKEWWYLLHHYYRFVRFPPDSTSPPRSTSFSLMTSQSNQVYQVSVSLRCGQRKWNGQRKWKSNGKRDAWSLRLSSSQMLKTLRFEKTMIWNLIRDPSRGLTIAHYIFISQSILFNFYDTISTK